MAEEITVAGEKVYSASDGAFVPAYRRPIGMVFQSYAIWPHMRKYIGSFGVTRGNTAKNK